MLGPNLSGNEDAIQETSGIASAGRETAGRVVSAGRIETSARHSCSLVTRDYATLIPPGARNNHQEGKINDGPTRRSCEVGTRESP